MAEWNGGDISIVVDAGRKIRETVQARFRSRVPGSTYIGTPLDFDLNTNADVYAVRKLVEQIAADTAAIRRNLGA